MVGSIRQRAGSEQLPASDAATADPMHNAPPGLARITRLGQQLLGGAPVQIVGVSRTHAGVLSASPRGTPPVPLATAQRLSTAEGVMSVTAPDGLRWLGAAVGTLGSGIRVMLCTSGAENCGSTRATLTDLAALAADVIELDDVRDDAAGLRELLGTASHDLRNPLAVLRAGLDTLSMHSEGLPDGQAERIAQLAVRQARRMGGMIDGLLSLTDLADEAEHETIDLRQLVTDALEAGRLSHELVELALDGDLPDEPVHVRGVPDSLARLLTNLVTNAAVHGGGRVWVGLRMNVETATISIIDDGPGMPDGSGLDTGERSHRSGGHGLGLVIARRITRRHHGTIEHHDRPGGGTVIEITLPLRPDGG